MTSEIAIPEQQGLSAQGFSQAIGLAHEKAKTLQQIVEQQKLYVDIEGSRHLKVEAWQTIGMAYKLAVRTDDSTKLIYENGKIIGVEAKATVVDIETGVTVGGATSYCFGSEKGKGQQAVAQWAGMAQTRASARALKQNLSWVVVLAGYSPTPAEEMMAAPIKRDTQDTADPAFWCQEHNTEFFKRGKMKSYGHAATPDMEALGAKKSNWHMRGRPAEFITEPVQDSPQEPQEQQPHPDDVPYEPQPGVDLPESEAQPSVAFENKGALFTWAQGAYKISRDDVAQAAGYKNADSMPDSVDLAQAQQQVIALYGG